VLDAVPNGTALALPCERHLHLLVGLAYSDGGGEGNSSAASASARSRTPTSRPSEVVTGRLERSRRRSRSTIASSRALGRIVLGPAVIASSTSGPSASFSAFLPRSPSRTRDSLIT